MPAKCCNEFYAKIPEDVPVFTIVAYDELASDVVMLWIQLAMKKGVNGAKVDRAMDHLREILDYQNTHRDKVKLPD